MDGVGISTKDGGIFIFIRFLTNLWKFQLHKDCFVERKIQKLKEVLLDE